MFRNPVIPLMLAATIMSTSQAQTVCRVDAAAPFNASADGSNWTTEAMTDVTQAIAYVRGLGAFQPGIIYIREGVYKPNGALADTHLLTGDFALYGGFRPGDSDDPASRSGTAGATVLSGDRLGDSLPGSTAGRSDDVDHVVTLVANSPGLAPSESVIIDRLTIQFGNANNSLPGFPQGLRGGGILVLSDLGPIGESSFGSGDFRDLIIEECHAGEYGGGASMGFVLDMRWSNCTFRNNRCITSGSSPSGIAGAVYVRHSGQAPSMGDSVHFGNCSFLNNVATLGGGVAATSLNGPLTFDNCLFSGNRASAGGGAYLERGSGSAAVSLRYCTIAGNVTRTFVGATRIAGAGIYIDANNGMGDRPPGLNLENSIVYGNLSFGESSVGSIPSLVDDIWPRTATSGVTAEYSNVRLRSPLSDTGSSTPSYFGVGMLSSDPQFGNPRAMNYRLKASSPCIDSGNDGLLAKDIADVNDDGDVVEFLPIDLDGNPREFDHPSAPNGAGVDLHAVGIADRGCYERN